MHFIVEVHDLKPTGDRTVGGTVGFHLSAAYPLPDSLEGVDLHGAGAAACLDRRLEFGRRRSEVRSAAFESAFLQPPLRGSRASVRV